MPVPVTHVIDTEARVEVVEQRLLPVRVRGEARSGLQRTWPCRNREWDDDHIVHESTRQHATRLDCVVQEAFSFNADERSFRDYEGPAHQKPSPVCAQFR